MLDCEPHRRTGLTGPIHYYNEYDAGAATWLRNLIEDGLIPYGHVDTRDIRDVQPDDLSGYAQCHFFAGIGGWARALSLAAWPEDREIWTGSCPCQPFSVAGRRAGTSDARHLWPDFLRLIAACRPAIVMGEQVAGAAGVSWFDGVGAGLDGEGYTSRAVDIPACSVDAPHQRSRLYWIAVANCGGAERRAATEGYADVSGGRVESAGRLGGGGEGELAALHGSFWSDYEWLVCHDDKARRTIPGVPLLVNGIPGGVVVSRSGEAGCQDKGDTRMIQRTAAWKGFGNAIVPPLAAEVIIAFLESEHG